LNWNTSGQLWYDGETDWPTGQSGSHAHTFTIAQGSGHSHAVTTGEAGGTAALNIANPFIVVNFIIKT
jgi:hypothetical protein